MRLVLCAPAWLGLWPRSVVSTRACQMAWLSKKCCEKVVLVCRSHSQKVLWMVFAGLFVCFWFFVCYCFFCHHHTSPPHPRCSFVPGSIRNGLSEAVLPLEPCLRSAERGMALMCVHCRVCVGSPLPAKALYKVMLWVS